MQDKKEFIQTIKDNEGVIFKISRAYTNDAEDQKDLYQEIVYQLWKSSSSFRGDSKVATWIYRVALNTSIAHLHKRKKKVNLGSFDFEYSNKFNGVDELMEERMNTLYAHIKELNVVDKGVIVLFLEGKSYEEIAIITGFSITNVGTRLSRIKQKLKTQIKK